MLPLSLARDEEFTTGEVWEGIPGEKASRLHQRKKRLLDFYENAVCVKAEIKCYLTSIPSFLCPTFLLLH